MRRAQEGRRLGARLAIVVAAALAGAVALGAHSSSAAVRAADPDMPGGPLAHLSADTYLKLRQQQIDQLRGANSPVAPTRRLQAVQQRAQQLGLGSAQGLAAPLLNSGGTWTNLGPMPIPNGQTEPTEVAVSGRVTAIAVHPTNPNIAYLGGAQGGVWRTTDGGGTWTPIFDTASSLAIGAIAIAPSSPSTVYVGTGEANLSCDSFDGIGVYRIDNADTSPTLVGPIDPAYAPTGTDSFGGRSISQILVKRDDPATIFVGTSNGVIGIGCDAARGGTLPPLPPRGLWRSTNATAAAGSVAFTKLTVTTAGSVSPDTTGNRRITDMVFDPGDATSNTLLGAVMGVGTGTEGGVYRTTNALAASPSFTQTLSLASDVRVALASNRVASTTTVLAATSESQIIGPNTIQGELHQSTDGGQTFPTTLSAADGFCEPQCSYDITVTMPSDDHQTIFLGGAVDGTTGEAILEKSTDGGTSFTPDDGTLHADTHAVTIAPSNKTIMYFGSDGGVWRSIDSGGTWTSRNTTGLSLTQFQSLAIHPSDNKFSIGGTQDNGTVMLKPDATFTRADFGDGGYALIDRNATDTTTVTMYHTYFNARANLIGYARVDLVANATEGNWIFMGCDNNIPANNINCTDNVNFFAPMALGPGSPNTVYFGSDRLYRSIDKGSTHTLASQAPLVPINATVGVPISAIGISPQNDNVRIVGLDNGQVFRTTTGSATLTDVTPTTGYRPQYVARAVIDPTNVNTAYITLTGYMGDSTAHVWKTTNLNAATPTWTQAASGIPDVPVDAFVVDPSVATTLYAGTDIGVYRSTDAGTSWAPFGNGLPVIAVFDMGLTAPGGSQVLRIATHGRGLWEIPVGSQVVVPEVPWTPLALVLLAVPAILAMRRLRLSRRAAG